MLKFIVLVQGLLRIWFVYTQAFTTVFFGRFNNFYNECGQALKKGFDHILRFCRQPQPV